jgi:hypothetical protein
MQFHLEQDELKLLGDVLLEEDARQYGEILSKVLNHDLRLDAGELEQTADLLSARKVSLKEEIARQADTARKAQLERRLALLNRVIERVNEACVMF